MTMRTPGAFGGSPTIKGTLLAAFDAIGEAPNAVPSLVAVLQDKSGAGVGYPDALTRLLARLVATLAEGRVTEERIVARVLARRCLADVAPGAELAAIPLQVLEAMLREVDARAALRVAAPALRDILLGVIALQTRSTGGDNVPKSDWAAIRARAVALTDGFEDPVLRDAGLAIESAAWDLTVSSGVLIDVFKPYSSLIAREALATAGWTTGDAARAETVLHGIYDETQVLRDLAKDVSIPALFRAREPELALRHAEHLKTRDASSRAVARALLDQILALLANAPVSTAEAVGA